MNAPAARRPLRLADPRIGDEARPDEVLDIEGICFAEDRGCTILISYHLAGGRFGMQQFVIGELKDRHPIFVVC